MQSDKQSFFSFGRKNPTHKMRESEKLFRKTYEKKSIQIERKINNLRYAFVLLFYVTTFSAYKSGSTPHTYKTLFWSSTIYLISTTCWYFYLKQATYKKWIKYVTTSIDLCLLFFTKYGFHFDAVHGWGLSIKEPATFTIFFLYINLAGLRLDRVFSIFTGVLAASLYALLLTLSIASGWMSFTSDSTLFADTHYLRLPTELAKILFLLFASWIIAYIANDTRAFLGQVSESDSKAKYNNSIMKNIIEKTEEVSHQLKNMMDTLTGKATGMKDNIVKQEASYSQDANSLQQLVDDSSEIDSIAQLQLQLISKIQERVERLKVSTAEITKEGKSSLERAKDTTSITAESLQSLQNTVLAVQEMKSQTQKIVNISNTINEISDRTNLLSLNASIEAARAGEHGKGFSVVAQEVQKLADQSMESSKEIQNIINSTVVNIEHTSKLIEKTSQKLQEVSQTAEANTTFLQELTTGIQKQEKLSFAIRSDSDNIAEIAQNICELTGKQNSALGDLEERNREKVATNAQSLSISSELEKVAKDLDENSDTLHNLFMRKDKLILPSEKRKGGY
ncbi:MAG: methyl-accepting chemotaxis protein [Spirochaetota bacterium]